jgi:ketosteroid isomerase-like protein
MKNSGPLEDRILIRELYSLYSDASGQMDTDAWLDCFTHDGEWNSHIFRCKGTEELRQQWDTLMANFEKVGFLSEIGPIEVTGDTARARSYAREIIRLKDGGLFKLIGAYDDYLVRQSGEWKFQRRDYRPLVEEA